MKATTKTKTVRLNQSLLNKVENWAKEENRNFNNMIETILIKEARNRA